MMGYFPQTKPMLCVQCKRDITEERHKLCLELNNGGKWLCLDCDGENWENKRFSRYTDAIELAETVDDLRATWRTYKPLFLDRWKRDKPNMYQKALKASEVRKTQIGEQK